MNSSNSQVVITWLCFISTLASIPLYQLKRLQSVMNSAAWLVFPSSRYGPITPLLHALHWLKAAERTDYKLALLVYKCRQGAASSYLADELCEPADFEAQCRLHFASSSSLVIRRTRYQLSVTELFRLLRLVSGTVYLSTSRPCSHCQSSAVTLRHISLGAASRDYVVVPEKWHRHFRTR